MSDLETLGPLLIGISLIVIAGRQFVRVWREWRYAAQRRAWPTTTGTITRSRVRYAAPYDDPNYSHAYTPEIYFEYTVGGIDHRRAEFVEYDPNTEETVRALVAQYPVGRRVTVAYDPHHPREGILAATTIRPQITTTAILGVLALAAGVVLVLVILARVV